MNCRLGFLLVSIQREIVGHGKGMVASGIVSLKKIYSAGASGTPMSYTTLCHWLETDEVTGTVTQLTADRLNSYSDIFDQLTAVDGHKPALGLEYHHDSGDEMDLSLEGGFELFDLNDIRYPEWLMALIGTLKANADSAKPTNNSFYVEFDQGNDGFSLAGFFRSFGAQEGDGKTTNQHPATEYLELYDKFCGCNSRSSKCLASFICKIGHPDWVGVMARGGNVVKLIAPLHEDNIETAKAFCLNHFGALFNPSCISIDSTFLEIQECLAQSVLRLSVDLDLDHDIFLPRLSLEVGPTITVGEEAEAWPESVMRLMNCLQISNKATSDFQRIFKILPRGIKRQSGFISGDLEIMYCRYHHLKASTTLNGSTIKSYMGAHYLKETVVKKAEGKQ
jgi:hypothetical protein